MPERKQSVAIVRTVVQLARTLGMRITAEGVETQKQFDWIAQNCDEVQGYFVSRPRPIEDYAILVGRPPIRRLAAG